MLHIHKIIFAILCCTILPGGCVSPGGFITFETTFEGEMAHLALAGSGTTTIYWDFYNSQGVKIHTLPVEWDEIYRMDKWNVPHTYAEGSGTKFVTIAGDVTGMSTGKAHAITTMNMGMIPRLQYLDCSNEQLTLLSVVKNTVLTYLNCSDNQLTGLDVSSNPALTHLDCRSNKLHRDALLHIFTALPVRAGSDHAVIFCTGNPGFAELTNEDKAVAEAKNWSIDE